MLNENGNRMLAYPVKISNITKIEGADKIELLTINNWNVVATKGLYEIGSMCIYFEIDSLLPEKPWCKFLSTKKYKVKTMKLDKFDVISQGLAIHPDEIEELKGLELKENMDLTEILGVVHDDEDDEIVHITPIKIDWGNMNSHITPIKRNLLIGILSRIPLVDKIVSYFVSEIDYNQTWPYWVEKTNEERFQNIPPSKMEKIRDSRWVATEKLDGCSATYTLKLVKGKHFKKHNFLVCSRNQIINPNTKQKDQKRYIEISNRFKIERVLKNIAEDYRADCVTLQGEIFGLGVQKRNYSMSTFDFRGFNLVIDGRKINPIVGEIILKDFDIKWVPIVYDGHRLPVSDTELITYSNGKSLIDGGLREGLVFRTHDGTISFKVISNDYLLRGKK